MTVQENDDDSSNHLPSKPIIDFQIAAKIEGEESQIATIDLMPGETLRAESGSMLFHDGRCCVMDTKLEGASSAFVRMLTGQNMFMTDFRYEGDNTGTVGLGTSFPSKILRLNLQDHPGSTLICQKGAYMASNPSVNIEMEFTKSLVGWVFWWRGFRFTKTQRRRTRAG